MDNTAIQSLITANWLTTPGLIVLGVIGLFLLQGVWSGWTQGFPRKMASLLLLGGTSYGAWYFREPMATLAGNYLPVPQIALELVAFFYTFIFSYLVLLGVSYCFLKKTKDIDGANQFIYGATGATLGVTTNLAIIGLFAIGSKYAHTFIEAYKTSEPEEGSLTSGAGANPTEAPKDMPRWVEYMGTTLGMLQETPIKDLVQDIEPIDTQKFRIGSKLTFFTRNARARSLFLQSPEAKQLLRSPTAHRLLADPEITKLANEGKWRELGNNKAVLDTLANPEAWEGVDLDKLEAAIDRAIAQAKQEVSIAHQAPIQESLSAQTQRTYIP